MGQRELEEFVERARGVGRREEIDRNAVGVLEAFEAAGVPSLLLKGPALAQLLYTEREYRGYTDVDLLVPADRLRRARDALRALGYTSPGAAMGIDDVADIQHSEIWARRGETGPLWIDLHWRLGGCDAPGDVVWSTLAEGRTSIDLQGREVAVPGRHGLALHLALHAAQHGPEDTKAMGDLARGVERWELLDTWRGAAALAQSLEAVPHFAAGLRLLPAGADLAERLDLPMAPNVDWEILRREARPRGTFHLRALADARGLRQYANVLRRSLLPSRDWITWEFRWAANSKLLLLVAYAWHILRTPAWALRARRFLRSARRGRR